MRLARARARLLDVMLGRYFRGIADELVEQALRLEASGGAGWEPLLAVAAQWEQVGARIEQARPVWGDTNRRGELR